MATFTRTAELLDTISHKPELFLELQIHKANEITNNIKVLYDLGFSLSENEFSEALPELLIHNFDEEQIWQQLELFNKPNIQHILKNIATFSTKSRQLDFAPKYKTDQTKLIKKDVETLIDVGNCNANNNVTSIFNTTDEAKLDIEHFDSENSDDSLSDNILQFGEMESGDESEEEKELKKMLDAVDQDNIASEIEDDVNDLNDNTSTKVLPEYPRTIVDDSFFSLKEMEKFLDEEDSKEMKKNKSDDMEDSDQLSDDNDDEGRHIMYSDFFYAPSSNQGTDGESLGDNNCEIEEESDGGDNVEESICVNDPADVQSQSTFEKRQKKMRSRIEAMESSAIDVKPWQLQGEVTAVSRPENSLLQEDLDFDHTTRQAPIITEETTKTLEELIIQRIKDKIYDDVERKVKPSEEMPEFRKRIVLDQEKSKKSLADIYEEEYMKQQEKEREEVENPDHEEIRKSMQALFVKLDALSNFYFRPKLSNPEVQIISNIPSISMEEVAPVNVSDAARLAPHEIKDNAKGDVVGDTEKTSTDKKRERRKKKIKQKGIGKAKEKKEKLKNAGGSVKSQKEAMSDLREEVKSGTDKMKNVKLINETEKSKLTSSSQFFSQLQDEVNTHIKNKKYGQVVPKKNISTQNFKL